MTAIHAQAPTRSARPTGWVPFALLALVLVPAVTGTMRLVEVFGGPHLMPANPRLTVSPLPVIVHIVCGLTYAVLGAFQFSATIRRRWPRWHRRAGRVLVVLGLAVAFSALFMTQFYARQPGTGPLSHAFRLLFGSALAACLVLGVTAIRRRDVAAHQAWMTRAYALALGAGTQVLHPGDRDGGLRPRRAQLRPAAGCRPGSSTWPSPRSSSGAPATVPSEPGRRWPPDGSRTRAAGAW